MSDLTCTNCGEYVGSPIADRIKELEAKLAQAEDFVLRTIRYAGNNGDDFLADKARAALAELKGEDRG
jgi:hypothetical protein